jgi:hypothetical protein
MDQRRLGLQLLQKSLKNIILCANCYARSLRYVPEPPPVITATKPSTLNRLEARIEVVAIVKVGFDTFVKEENGNYLTVSICLVI